MKAWILLVAAGMAMGAPAADAHHAIGNAYDSSREITVEGVVTEFHFVYPHPFVTIDVKQDSASKSWILEMDNRSELAQIGVTSETLKPGDRVVVSGSPDRKGGQSLYVRRLDRPADGFRYEQVGYSPRIRAGAGTVKDR